jgi:hypothetical protein
MKWVQVNPDLIAARIALIKKDFRSNPQSPAYTAKQLEARVLK